MILIASYSGEQSVTQPIVDILIAKGEEVLLYEADLVASGKISFGFMQDKNTNITCHYGNIKFDPVNVEAAWYRRPDIFGPDELNKTFLIYLDRQRKSCQDSLWYAIPEDRWINAPKVLDSSKNHDKLLQLRIAKEVGFKVPRSVIGNNWKDVYHSFRREEVIMKLPNGRMYVGQEPHFLVTTIVDGAKKKKLERTIPFPGIWQDFVQKKKEWRITVIGTQIFPAAIYTSEKARADWRKHQFDNSLVQFKSEPIPKIIEEKCIAMLKRFDAKFGAFDFIESNDGSFTFLEVNLNGQYQWLVDELKLPIPKAIAEELLKIKKESSKKQNKNHSIYAWKAKLGEMELHQTRTGGYVANKSESKS